MSENNLTGHKYGLLTVTEKLNERQEHYVLWRCKCECGGEILVNSKRLKRGTVQNCGCIPKTNSRKGRRAEDISGQLFGKLTVLYRTENQKGRACWMCRCECGTEKEYCSSELKGGKKTSCGCDDNGMKRIKDISNQRFGRLVAQYPTEKRDRKCSVYWHCRCDCGKEVDVTSDRLLHNSYKSCGCLKQENQKAIFNKLHVMDGTCVEWLEKRKHRKDNKSGFRGVNQLANGKYRVTIGFKRQKYYLGVYSTFEEAVQIRLKAEEIFHDSFIKAYYQWKEYADQNPEWAKTNKFSYENNIKILDKL